MNRILPIVLLLAACARGPAEPPPLAHARIGGPFALVDGDGRPVTDRSFAGRYRIMYFGYTWCPDACPTDLAKIGAAMRLLRARDPALARQVVPVFVSVDPARDTPAVVKRYVAAFDPQMVGLTGSQPAVDAAAKAWAVYAKRDAPTTPGGAYLVQHSVVAYLMGRHDEPLAILPTDSTPEAVADDIERWAA